MADGFKLDYKGLGLYLKSPEMQVIMLDEAEKAKARAIASAPVETGEYADSFDVIGGVAGDRAYAILRNASDHALEVEFGRKGTPRHRTLGKAVGGTA